MANLHFHYGVMGSSKSAMLLINAHNFYMNGVKTEIIKPAFVQIKVRSATTNR